MMLAKRLVNYLPTSAQKGITAAWGKIRGNPELHVLEILNDRSAPHWRPSNQPIRSGTSKCAKLWYHSIGSTTSS